MNTNSFIQVQKNYFFVFEFGKTVEFFQFAALVTNMMKSAMAAKSIDIYSS